MDMQVAAREAPLSIPSGSGSGWIDSQSAPTYQASVSTMQVSELHYNYADHSPSTFASPTGSSPSASPQYTERRRRNSAFPLFLAQHTSAAPITIEPLDASNSGWPASSPDDRYSPPSSYHFVQRTGQTIGSMEFMSPPISSHAFPPPYHFGHVDGAGLGMHRRRLSMASPSQSQFQAPPQTYHMGTAPFGTIAHERERYHENAEFPAGRTHFAQEHERFSQQEHSFYSHYGAVPPISRPLQPQLLLATPMPTNTPVVIGMYLPF